MSRRCRSGARPGDAESARWNQELQSRRGEKLSKNGTSSEQRLEGNHWTEAYPRDAPERASLSSAARGEVSRNGGRHGVLSTDSDGDGGGVNR